MGTFPNMIEGTDTSAEVFLECLESLHMKQNVIEPTFQIDLGINSSVLDLILTENENRIFKLEHLPPIGVITHAHHVLKFSYSTEGSENVKKVEKFRFNYKEGNYSKISASILEIDWKNEFKNLNTNEQYEKWVKIYSNLCNEHIPKIKIRQGRFKPPWLGLDSKIKTLIKSKNNQW